MVSSLFSGKFLTPDRNNLTSFSNSFRRDKISGTGGRFSFRGARFCPGYVQSTPDFKHLLQHGSFLSQPTFRWLHCLQLRFVGVPSRWFLGRAGFLFEMSMIGVSYHASNSTLPNLFLLRFRDGMLSICVKFEFLGCLEGRKLDVLLM